ncbi:hypothetical protein BLOT_002651 [Blomia tropicalis]|nr:hypothetical protein BLOT_002651 [Blomia tropicalis]
MYFCARSTVFHNMVVVVTTVHKFRYNVFRFDHRTNTIKPYNMERLMQLNHDDPTSLEYGHDFLPSINVRLFTSIEQIFLMSSNNPLFMLTAATYEHYGDCLYMAISIKQSKVFQSKAWHHSRYVVMKATINRKGLITDSVVVAELNEPIIGMIDHNGELFLLTNQTFSVRRLVNNSLTGFNQTMKQFLFDSEPLIDPIREPLIDRTFADLIPNIDRRFFPHFGKQIVFMESPLLQGFTFFAIISGLLILLVLIIIADGYIMMNISKKSFKSQIDWSSPSKTTTTTLSSKNSKTNVNSKTTV